MEKRSKLPTAAGQRAYANSGGTPRRNWGRLLTHRLGIGRHSLAQFGVRAPIRSRRDSQQIHPRGQLARDSVGGSPIERLGSARPVGTGRRNGGGVCATFGTPRSV